MKNTFIIPLVLLASISTLTSCSQGTQKIDTLPPVASTGSTGGVTPVIPVAIDVMPGEGAMESGLMPAVMTGSQGEITPPAPRDPTSARESDSITRTGVESYQSPAGLDQIEFTVSVKDGVITAASSKVLATNDASKYNQGNFAKEVSAKVVGKSTKDFQIDAIGGASLTTAAFEKFVGTL